MSGKLVRVAFATDDGYARPLAVADVRIVPDGHSVAGFHQGPRLRAFRPVELDAPAITAAEAATAGQKAPATEAPRYQQPLRR